MKKTGLLIAVMCIALLATAARPVDPVTAWGSANMVKLRLAGPVDDLKPLKQPLRGAQIVGLGESAHGLSEELRLKHRMLRFLVEQLGFRSIAWEEQWTTGFAVNDYIGGGSTPLDAVVGQLGFMWQNREVADVLRWLRAHNTGRADKVRFVGVEYYWTGRLAYKAIDAYVAKAAPERLAELRTHLAHITPPPELSIPEYADKYRETKDKRPLIQHAHRVYDLVADLPRKLAAQHARQIVSFYEHYSLSDADALVYRDARAAENLRWWREETGDKIAYWAASPHTANAPNLRITGDQEMRFPSAGSYLRRWYGQKYVSIGFTFDHGAGYPAPQPNWFEQPLGGIDTDQFALDLHRPAPPAIRNWLHGPATTRGLVNLGPDSEVTGGSLAQWFDLLVHRQQVT